MLFNWKGGNLEKYEFQLKLYEKGEHNIQFQTVFHFFAFEKWNF